MKRTISILLMLCLLLAGASSASAEQPPQNAVYELYSADGCYVDGVGNKITYSFHVPQIHASSSDAESINSEIAEQFGERIETQFRYMKGGYSLWSWRTEWKAFWNGTQLFLLITAEENGDITVHGAFGYDFDTGNRVTNRMILEQKGISEEEYLEKLREKVQLMFEDLYYPAPEGVPTKLDHDKLLERTLNRLNLELPMFLDQDGEIKTIVEIDSIAGAGIYEHLVAPFSEQCDSD